MGGGGTTSAPPCDRQRWLCAPQVLVVRFVSLFDVKDRTVTFLGGKKYSVDSLRAMGAGDLLNSMFDFSEKLVNLGLSEEEMSLFTAVVLVSAGGFVLVKRVRHVRQSRIYI